MSGDCGPFVPLIAANGPSGGGGGIRSIAGGTTLATGPLVSFLNANNVSFGISGGTLTASVIPETGIGLAVPGTTLATGTVVLSNSNGVSFGINGSTVTASIAAGATATGNFGALAAVGGTITSGTASFLNGSGVSFGVNGQTITASVGAGATATGNLGAISAAGASASNGTIVFSNSNGASFGMNGSTITVTMADVKSIFAGTTRITNGEASFSNGSGVSFGVNGQTITASVAAGATATGNLGAISAAGASASAGTIVWSNSNNVSFGMAGSTITASASFSIGGNRVSLWENGALPANIVANAGVVDFNSTQAAVQRISFQQSIDATRLDVIVIEQGLAGYSSYTITGYPYFYTINASTASVIFSTSGTFSFTAPTVGTAFRLVSFPLGTFAITPGDYLFAFGGNVQASVATGSTADGRPTLAGQQFAQMTGLGTQALFVDRIAPGISTNSRQVSQMTVAVSGRPYIRLMGTGAGA